jgi:hypothetical protein
MDPTETSVISAAALAALQPYWPIIAKKSAEELGKGVPAAIGKLWSAVRKRFSGEEAAKKALEQLLSDPQNPKLQAVVEWQLGEILKKDPAFAGELKGLLPEGGVSTGYSVGSRGVFIGGKAEENIIITGDGS